MLYCNQKEQGIETVIHGDLITMLIRRHKDILFKHFIHKHTNCTCKISSLIGIIIFLDIVPKEIISKDVDMMHRFNEFQSILTGKYPNGLEMAYDWVKNIFTNIFVTQKSFIIIYN